MIKAMTVDMGADAMKPMFRRYINDARKAYPTLYTQFMKEESTDQYFEEYNEIGGFGTVPLLDEGDYMNFALPDIGNKTRVQPERRQLAFGITYQDKKFNKIDKVRRYTEKLGKAFKKQKERTAIYLFNQGFSTNYLLNDNQPLFSTAHVLSNGETYANRPAADVDLNMATLEAAITSFLLLKDNDGTPIQVMPKYLLVHPSNFINAKRLLESTDYYGQAAGVPNGSFRGVRNVVADMNLTIISHPFLEDEDAWFLLPDKSEHELVLLENEKLHDRTFTDDYTEDIIYSMAEANVAAPLTAIGVWGTSGG